MTRARCPRCDGLFGPTVSDLLVHLRNAHGLATDWYEASTGTLKLVGSWLPGTLEFVEESR